MAYRTATTSLNLKKMPDDGLSTMCQGMTMDIIAVLENAVCSLKNDLLLHYDRIFHPQLLFRYRNRYYRYFDHEYNQTKLNERTIEVPIIWDTIGKYMGKEILEVGNVLPHYYTFKHDVVDKFEQVSGVINEDIVDFSPGKRYDLIVSISTLEHVGYDEEPRDPQKIIRTVEHLKTLLKPGGRMMITLPVGYNRPMDELLKNGAMPFTEQYYLLRMTGDNQWAETGRDEVMGAMYGSPFPYANGIVICIYIDH
jgi:SAM-dependent methyltransferase